jgi:hypothetical protein
MDFFTQWDLEKWNLEKWNLLESCHGPCAATPNPPRNTNPPNPPPNPPPPQAPAENPTYKIFRFIKDLSEQHFYDISDFIPNTMLRIRSDANIPNPILSFIDTAHPGQFYSNYTEIPEGIELVFCSVYPHFKLEHFDKLKKLGQIAQPHNKYMYNLFTHHNYQILYRDKIVLSLIQEPGWNIVEP